MGERTDGHISKVHNDNVGLPASGVSVMLEGYYDIVRRAVCLTMAVRCIGISALAWMFVH